MARKLVFVGGGNMARSLIGGLRRAHNRDSITVVEPDTTKHEKLTRDFDVVCVTGADAETLNADAVVLAVKPQVLPRVAESLQAPMANSPAAVVSIAAGVPLSALVFWFGANRPIVRCMPNTPALIGAGITGLYAPPGVDSRTRELAEAILGVAGETIWVDVEDDLNVVTGISGSGPAYFFAFIESLQAAARAEGLDADTARHLATKTALGATRMAAESSDDAATLRANVTSPGGTTEKALAELYAADLDGTVARAVRAAVLRAGELADELDPSRNTGS